MHPRPHRAHREGMARVGRRAQCGSSRVIRSSWLPHQERARVACEPWIALACIHPRPLDVNAFQCRLFSHAHVPPAVGTRSCRCIQFAVNNNGHSDGCMEIGLTILYMIGTKACDIHACDGGYDYRAIRYHRRLRTVYVRGGNETKCVKRMRKDMQETQSR